MRPPLSASSSLRSMAVYGLVAIHTICAQEPSPKATPPDTWIVYRKATEPLLKLLPAEGRVAVESSLQRERAPAPAGSGETGALLGLQGMESRITRSLKLAGKADLLAELDRWTHAWWRYAAQQTTDAQISGTAGTATLEALAGTHLTTLEALIRSAGVPLLAPVTLPERDGLVAKGHALLDADGGSFDEVPNFNDKSQFIRTSLDPGEAVVVKFWVPARQRAVVTLRHTEGGGDMQADLFEDPRGDSTLGTISASNLLPAIKMIKYQESSGYVVIRVINRGSRTGKFALFTHTLTYHGVVLKEVGKAALKAVAKQLLEALLSAEESPDKAQDSQIQAVVDVIDELFRDDRILNMEIDAAKRWLREKVGEVSKDNWAAELTLNCGVALLEEIWKCALVELD